jgi:putative transposase
MDLSARDRFFHAKTQKLVPALKKQHPWLAGPPSHALQQAAVDLDLALRKVQDGAGFPKLKRKGRSAESFRENDPALFRVDQHNSRIKVPKLGWVRYHNSRTFEGIPKTLTVIRKGKHWFASLQVELPQPATAPVHPHKDKAVGIDRGVTVFAALSDGTHIAPLSPLKAAAGELRVAQRAHARKKRGSKNRRKAAQQVQRIHRKVADIRKDFLHKASTAIAQNHGVVVLETLEVQSMTATSSPGVAGSWSMCPPPTPASAALPAATPQPRTGAHRPSSSVFRADTPRTRTPTRPGTF